MQFVPFPAQNWIGVLTGILLFAVAATSTAENRTFDGSGNNLANPDWGAAGTNFARRAASAYDDGVSSPSGADRPNARVASNIARQRNPRPDQRRLSGFVYAFGQFLNHDLEFTASGREPFHIGQGQLPLFRSAYDAATGTSLDRPRQQVNGNSHYLDASNVFGSDSDRAIKLREPGELPGAKLLTSGSQNLLPRNTIGVHMDEGGFGIPQSNLFAAGDLRANENVALTSLHTLFMREHNRLVDDLAGNHPTWSQEELYQRSRKIVGAELQAITYHEFLPTLLGPHALTNFEGYDPTVDASVFNEFATVALRVGHSMLPKAFRRINDDGTPDRRDPVSVDSPFESTDWLTSSHDLDVHLKGLALEH